MSVVSLKCPNCEGELLFDPATQRYKCEYCGSDFSQDEMESFEPQSGDGPEEEETCQARDEDTGEEEERAVLYRCPSCGAELVTDETTAATFCYYCHNPVVLSGQVSGEFKPDFVIPFEIDRKQAEEHFLEFVRKKKFVPNAFFNSRQIEKLSGIYFPYWVYNGELQGRLEAEGSKIRVWMSGDVEYTETKIYRMEREGTVSLHDLTKNAWRRADMLLAEGVLPYDFSKAKEFHLGFLSGFFAEKRDVEQEELKPQVDQEADRYTQELLESTIHGYTGVHTINSSSSPREEDWSYVLLPVWTVTYKGQNGKMYYYSMNGQNGRTFGELPVDYKKVFLWAGIIGVIVLLLLLIGGYFL